MLSTTPSFVQPSPALPMPYAQPPPTPYAQPPLASPSPLWQQKFPTVISSILSFVQFVITITIIGCEVAGMLIDVVSGTIYVGLWGGLFFISASMALSVAACCCRSRLCATYTLAIQLISMFFALCVIGFGILYTVSPNTCFFPSYLCNSTAPTRGVLYTEANFNNVKIPLIKTQLAAGIVMFILCAVYVMIYGITSFRVYRAKQPKAIHPIAQNPLAPPAAISSGVWGMPPMVGFPTHVHTLPHPMTGYPPSMAGYHMPMSMYPSPMMLHHGDGRMTELSCPSCKSMMNMTATKQPMM